MNIKELDSPQMTWTQKKIVDVQWQYANITRHIRNEKNVINGIKRWWHLRQLCKKTNKTLLRLAKELENKGLHKPPTANELAEFKENMGGAAVFNTHHVSSVVSKTKNIDMDINYGN